MIDLTDREKVLIAAAASISLMLGFWWGIWSVPVEALSVPTDSHYDGNGGMALSPVYRPVPTWLPVLTVLVPAVAIYGSYRKWLVEPDDELESQPEVAADD